MRLGIYGLRFWDSGVGCWVLGVVVGVKGLGVGVQEVLMFRRFGVQDLAEFGSLRADLVSGLWFRLQALGFGV